MPITFERKHFPRCLMCSGSTKNKQQHVALPKSALADTLHRIASKTVSLVYVVHPMRAGYRKGIMLEVCSRDSKCKERS